MANVDRDTLWSTGHDESVEVNQRALIDKVLARYSGEFTVFRELLQNSDDAASKAVEIRFETKAFLDGVAGRVPEESSGVPDLKQPVHQWTFRNNGIIFREEDWTRLKKIAEGNPDEEKIGAFGVGFYSLFSVTEEPFVKSGEQWMGFYWKDKKDQLFARRGNLPALDSTESDPHRQWTTFEMELREAAPMPSAFDFVRFLTSSITFMAHLESVEVWLNGCRLAKVTKDKGAPRDLAIPKGLRSTSDARTMFVRGVNSTSLNISAEVLRLVYTGGSEKKPPPRAPSPPSKANVHSSFFSSLFSSFSAPSPVPPSPLPLPSPELEIPDPMLPTSSHVILSVFSANVDVSLDRKMIAELHRSTKKNPPNKLKLELIYTGKDEYDASKLEEEGLFQATGSIFQGLRADLDGVGSSRIFIGHATGQTTGLGGHISGRFIPTVERESIDLVDRNVTIWNKELLYVAGLLARVAYELEIANVRTLWAGASESNGGTKSGPDPDLRNWLQNRCLHALLFFTARPSTPSAVVSNLIETAFFGSSLDNSFPIISTAGVLDARSVRAFDPVYSGFIKELPVLPIEVASSAKGIVDALRARGMVKEITFADVLTELRSRALTQQEMVECFKWRIDLDTGGIRPAYLTELRREFLDAAMFTIVADKTGEKIVPLSTIRTVFIPRNAASSIPADSPLPEHTLPYSLSRQVKAEALLPLLGWTELTVPEWLEHLVSPAVQNRDSELDMTKSAVWAEKVLSILARAWSSLSKEHQAQIVASLKNKTCIPTKFGMKVPEDAYFLNANVFPDLPIVTMPKGTPVKGTLEKVLLALGVRQHVDLQVVFNRMIRTGDWGIPDLIRYLVAVEASLTTLEMNRLRETAAFPTETTVSQPTENVTETTAPNEQRSKVRYRAMDLYEPSSALRELGLPVIAWGALPRWRASSDEAKFLFKLGLRRQPALNDLLSLAAGPDPTIRQAALKYFLENTAKYPEYDIKSFANVAFVPAIKPTGTAFIGRPQEVYTDKDATVMGFFVVDPSLPADAAIKLKLPKTPPTDLLLEVLQKTPTTDIATARSWFEFLAAHLTDFSTYDIQRLSTIAFIPVSPATPQTKTASPPNRLLTPQQVYLGSSYGGFHSQLFTFVDFGTRANNFLMACGVRSEPTVDELAKILVADPHNFYKLAGGLDKFLVELRNIAVNYRGISTSTRNQMKKSPCLVASRRAARLPSTEKHRKKKSNSLSDDEDEGQWEHDLLIPNKIAIVDDTATYTLFNTIFSAPQEDILEEFYAALGSPRLSTLVREEYKPSAIISNSIRASETRGLVLERLPLFLHERTQGKPVVAYTWLNKEENFVINEVGKLTLIRTLQFGTTRMVKSQEASATADRKGNGPITLWLGGNTQVDMYEVSNSLCRVLLQSHKPNDSLLFMTILSTDLRALRRRGFNIDRILRQQQAERDAQAVRGQQQLISSGLTQDSGPNRESQQGFLGPPKDVDNRDRNSGFLSNWRQKLHRSAPNNTQLGPQSPSSSSPPLPSNPMSNGIPSVQNPMRPYGQGPTWNSNQGVTPHANIARNVSAAIQGCRAENNSAVRSQAHATRIKEAMDEGYCDTMGAIDLDFIGYCNGSFKVFVSHDFPDAKAIVEGKGERIARFGDFVLQPLIRVYNIPPVNIFWDASGPLIAFNRNGSIFVNLRYYEAWHDADVQNGDVAQAQISWFFSFAHEIAHNLVHPHNSEHEFYFSTICEQHMVKLAALLGHVPNQ